MVFDLLSIECTWAVGMMKLIETVEAVVRDVLGGMSLKDSMTSTDVHDLVREVRCRIETQSDSGSTAPATGLYRFMLPDPDSLASAVAQVDISRFELMVCELTSVCTF